MTTRRPRLTSIPVIAASIAALAMMVGHQANAEDAKPPDISASYPTTQRIARPDDGLPAGIQKLLAERVPDVASQSSRLLRSDADSRIYLVTGASDFCSIRVGSDFYAVGCGRRAGLTAPDSHVLATSADGRGGWIVWGLVGRSQSISVSDEDGHTVQAPSSNGAIEVHLSGIPKTVSYRDADGTYLQQPAPATPPASG